MSKIYFSYKREIKQNPYIGFTSFQHFRNDELYSDLVVKPENNMTETEHVECYPIPSYVEEKGREQGYYPDCSIVYIRILWKEFEPVQNEYNYSFIQDILDKAKANNQVVMFRLMPHSTRESDDVPDWVKGLIDCPARPVGERVKVSPTNPLFLELFGKAIKEIAIHFDDNHELGFVDVSLPGAWGEGSSVELFSNENLEKFVDIYTDYFKKTLLIGQISAPWVVNYMNKSANVGWRADCIGHPRLLHEYVPSMKEQMPEIWKKAHISFESYWWLGEWQRKEWDLDEIIKTTLDWHISSFNAKSLPIPNEWKDKIDKWIDKMGYHYLLKWFDCPNEMVKGGINQLSFEMDNIGVAPSYVSFPVYIKLKNDKNEYSIKTNIDVKEWEVGENIENVNISIPKDILSGDYDVLMSIYNEQESISMCIDTKVDDNWYYVGKTTIR